VARRSKAAAAGGILSRSKKVWSSLLAIRIGTRRRHNQAKSENKKLESQSGNYCLAPSSHSAILEMPVSDSRMGEEFLGIVVKIFRVESLHRHGSKPVLAPRIRRSQSLVEAVLVATSERILQSHPGSASIQIGRWRLTNDRNGSDRTGRRPTQWIGPGSALITTCCCAWRRLKDLVAPRPRRVSTQAPWFARSCLQSFSASRRGGQVLSTRTFRPKILCQPHTQTSPSILESTAQSP
jgi:hypothetical protein